MLDHASLLFKALLCLLIVNSTLQAMAQPKTLLPFGSDWRYATNYPAEGWQEAKYNDKAWPQAAGGFGDLKAHPGQARTAWPSGQVWLRKEFTIDIIPAEPQLTLRHRGDVQVYLNGKLVADFWGNSPHFVPVPIQGEAQKSLRRGRNVLSVHATCIGNAPLVDVGVEDAAPSGKADAPLFRDPRFDGAADPTLIWDRTRKVWTMFYTQRRARVKELPGVGYCYGCDIGMAISSDGGRTWQYDGEAMGLEYEGGRNTFWAPEVIYALGKYHMFVSYTRGVRTSWGGNPFFVHFTSDDLKHWTFSDIVAIENVIDASVFPLPSGGWRMFFKRKNQTHMADSPDLITWKESGVATKDQGQEGPYVFRWKDRFWMIADVWRGQAVYSSEDLTTWTRQQGETLLGTPVGKRRDDGAFGRHAMVVLQEDRAFIVYFTHPGGDTNHDDATSMKRTSVQVAELEFRDGNIVCDRDKPPDYFWKAPKE